MYITHVQPLAKSFPDHQRHFATHLALYPTSRNKTATPTTTFTPFNIAPHLTNEQTSSREVTESLRQQLNYKDGLHYLVERPYQ